MNNSKTEIKKFLGKFVDGNYSEAYKHLETVLYEKTKKRCSDEYDRVKNSLQKNK